MFTRQHRIGGIDYTEVLESYRDPVTGRPTHRCVARWQGGRSVNDELEHARQLFTDVAYRRHHMQEVVGRYGPTPDPDAPGIDPDDVDDPVRFARATRKLDHCAREYARALSRVVRLLKAREGLAKRLRALTASATPP